ENTAHPEEHGQGHQGGDDGDDGVESASPGTGGIVENCCAYGGGHYFFTAIFSASFPSPRPMGRVRTMKPAAKIANTTNSILAWFSIVDFINRDASPTPITDAIVVFFVSAMRVLPSGTMAARSAWGKMMDRKTSLNPSPRDRAASA